MLTLQKIIYYANIIIVKILIKFILLFFSFSLHAAESDIYICKTEQNFDTTLLEKKDYPSENFKFEWIDGKIKFNKGGYFDDYQIEISKSINEYFLAGDDTSRLIYRDNLFVFSQVFNTEEEHSVTTIIAYCEIF